jgi:hypothetical protein
MTCRVARSSRDHVYMDLVFCCECGSANLEVCSTSKTLGPHLCPICAQSIVECGVSKESTTRPTRKEPYVSEPAPSREGQTVNAGCTVGI